MAIGYDDMTVRDAFQYFNGCWAFRISNNGQHVTHFTLDMGYDGECEDEMAHDYTFNAIGRVNDDMSQTYVTGEELFCSDEWITHRFQVGYIPLSANGLVRVVAEPVNSRMCKGLQFNHCQSLPVVVANEGDTHQRIIRRVQGTLIPSQIPKGIASVLALGTPPVMRCRVPLPEAFVRARARVAEFMRDGGLVCVPDFRMALVKYRNDPDSAYILYNGAHIGSVHLINRKHVGVQEPKLNAVLLRSRLGRKISDYIESTREQMTHNLVTTNVTWADR